MSNYVNPYNNIKLDTRYFSSSEYHLVTKANQHNALSSKSCSSSSYSGSSSSPFGSSGTYMTHSFFGSYSGNIVRSVIG